MRASYNKYVVIQSQICRKMTFGKKKNVLDESYSVFQQRISTYPRNMRLTILKVPDWLDPGEDLPVRLQWTSQEEQPTYQGWPESFLFVNIYFLQSTCRYFLDDGDA